MIDSHCHLAAPQFADDLEAVLERARAAGIERMICIGDTMEESEKGLEIAEKYEQVFCTVGVHPHAAKEWFLDTKSVPPISTRDDIAMLRSFVTRSKKVVGLGEMGLDYHYDLSPRDVQRSVFRTQLMLAKELSLPAVIHCREAVEDVWTIVDDVKPEKIVIHCCTEKWEDVKRFTDRGYFLSFTGIATYAKSDEMRRTIKECPVNQMMIETDAPFLAPVPHRGKRNEPSFVIEVAKCVGEIRGLSVEEIDTITTRNTESFFNLT